MYADHSYCILTFTTAREASRRIVEGLIFTAGGDMDDMPEEYSPSIVVKGNNYQDDTF